MKNSIFTRYLSILLAACLLLSNVAPVFAFAQETKPADSTIATEEATTEAVEEVTTEAAAETTTEAAEPAQTETEAAAETTVEASEPAAEGTTEAETGETTEAVTEPETEATTEAATEAATEATTEATEETSSEMDFLADEEATEETREEMYVDDYDFFLENLMILEEYADEFVAMNPMEDPKLLVINYIRCGVQRYTEGLWNTLAKDEKVEFTAYVTAMDEERGTKVGSLRNIYLMEAPNGQFLEFEHMFGTLNICYVTNNVGTDDLAGWGGDLCDLMQFAQGKATGATIEELTQDVRKNYLGVEGDGAFGWEDVYGDLDAFYLDKMLPKADKLSDLFQSYFTEDLTDRSRAEFFLHKRFSGLLTNEDVRNAVYEAYAANKAIAVLEGERNLKGEADLRYAACYAFADYLYDLAGDTLTGEVEETTAPTEETVPDETTEATEGETEETEPTNPYYSVFSSTDSQIAPGVKQTIKYAYTADDKQIVYYIATVDVAREDVSIHANYKDNTGTTWGMARVVDQMAAAQERHTDPEKYPELYIENYNVVLGTNADFFNMSTGAPSGALVMEGVHYNSGKNANFFAVLDDGTPIIGAPSDWATYEDRIVEAVGGSIFLVRDGKLAVTATSNYYNDRASRTCIGIREDGQVVMMVLDGRQEPFSAGGSAIEIAQIMLDAGCVTAINLDGGGSTTFAAKAEGADKVTVINRPSDGFPRSVSSSLMVVSTAKITNEFDHALIESEFDYVTVGTPLQLTAVGVSGTGNAADVPENAQWQLSDDTMGTIAGGIFTAAKEGQVEVRLLVDGKIVGSTELNVVTPTGLIFEAPSVNAIYAEPVDLPLTAVYRGNPVAFSVENDVALVLENNKAGTLDGLTFTGIESSGIRNIAVMATLAANSNVTASIQINLYRADEAVFDFDQATAGDRILAWNRDVTNSKLEDGSVHHIIDPNGAMDISYVFALDMESIEIPAKLQELVFMLPGGDNPNATAWDFLLQLAERVSVLTEVRVDVQFDPNLDVDVSELKVSNDFFKLHSLEHDKETNKVVLIAKWIDRDAAIDPATANPMCILSGIKAKVKDGADWGTANALNIVNSGEVSYDVFLRANALYSNAIDPEFQEEFQLYPFNNEAVIIGGTTEKGAHYQSVYTKFTDTFKLDRNNRNGWYTIGDFPTYFVNNEPISGIHKVPSPEDPAKQCVYEFNEDGTIAYAFTGFVSLEDGIYRAVNGELKTGWQTNTGADGSVQYYYFDPVTYKAVDGDQTIGGYSYIFEDHQLIRGQVVKTSGGTRYMWAGDWLTQSWIDLDGNISYCLWSGYFATGRQKLYSPEGDYLYYVFDDDGVWMKDYTNFYEEDGKMYFIQDGIFLEYPGIVKYGDEYFYISSTNILIKGCNYWTSKGNGYFPDASYTFGERGEMIPKGTEFTITWANEDGTVLKKDNLKAGAAVKYTGTTPTKKADAQYTYTFAGWSPEFSKDHSGKVTAIAIKDVTHTAVYNKTLNKYKVTFVDENGKVLQQGDVEYGTVPAYTGAQPTKASTAQYTYTFAGWDKELSAVTKEVTYTAVFTATLRSYTVSFRNEDGSLLQEVQVEYGKTPAYTGEIPAKAKDVQYSYTFAGWDREFATVTGNAAYTATYTKELNKYTVTFKNDNGSILQQSAFDYGTMPVYSGETPVKAATAQATYTFAGWSPALTPVSGDTVYTAIYTSEIKGYTVKFQNEDGSLLLQTKVPHGETPVYTGEIPTKARTAKFSYEFAGWDQELAPVSGNMIYTATFTPILNKYTVTFCDEDGTVLQESEVAYGEVPSYTGATPTKAADAQYTYTFSAWDKVVSAVTDDVTYTAQYRATTNTYTVTWVNEDGTLLEKDSAVAYGTMPQYNGATPAKAGTANHTYTFAGWTPEVAAVSGDVTYTAVYDVSIKEYTISWDTDGDGKVDETTKVPYGEIPVHEDGFKANEGQVGYDFAGWKPALTAVTGDATYTATFEITAAKFTVTFQDEEGNVLRKERFIIDTMPVFEGTPTKEADAQYTYTFVAWDRAFEPVTKDTTYTASFERSLNSHSITFKDEDGTVLRRYKVYYGDTPEYTGNDPRKPEDRYNSYVFKGWEPEIGPVTGPTTYTAVFEAIPHKNGIVEENGSLYYYVYGTLTYAGLIEIEGNYYYVRTNGEVVNGQSYWITKTNGLVIEGSYEFESDGRMVIPEIVEPDVEKNGIVSENGSLYYYVDGVLNYAGLIQIEGSYYYVRSNGELAHSCDYWITKTNGLMAERSYTFADDGRMVLSGSGEIDPNKNGIVSENGGLYYYENGIPTYAGLIKLNGKYYYVRTSGQLVTGRSYWITKTNGLMAEGSYRFAGDGSVVDPVEADATKDGIVAENGGLYYYKDGVLNYAGVLCLDGAYYYVKTNGQVVTGRSYWITKTNNLLAEGSYLFGEDGKLVSGDVDLTKDGIVPENGSKFYYEDGKLVYAGLIEVGGKFYYVKTNGELVQGQKFWVSKTNDTGVPKGVYEFDANGVMKL